MLFTKIKNIIGVSLFSCLLICIFIAAVSLPSFADTKSTTVQVIIKNDNVTFTEDTGIPFINSSNRTLVPMRVVMEKYGCAVDWNQENKTAIVKKDNVTVEVPVGKDYLRVNGKDVNSDSAAQLVKGRIYLPIAIVLEAVGADVKWDNSIRSVLVDSMPSLPKSFEEFSQEFQIIDSKIIDGYNQYGVVAKSNNLSSAQLSYLLTALSHEDFFKYSLQLVEKEKIPHQHHVQLFYVSRDYNLEKDYALKDKSAYMVAHIGNAFMENGKLGEFLASGFYNYQAGKRH